MPGKNVVVPVAIKAKQGKFESLDGKEISLKDLGNRIGMSELTVITLGTNQKLDKSVMAVLKDDVIIWRNSFQTVLPSPFAPPIRR